MAHDRYISPFRPVMLPMRCSIPSRTITSSAPGAGCGLRWPRLSRSRAWDITDEQISELEAHKDDINYEEATAREKLVRHDVMSHVYAYGLQCPKAKGIIHLGATSCYVGDNTDVIIMREGLQLVRKKLIERAGQPGRFCRAVQGYALPGLHPLPARPADHRWQARYPVDERVLHGPAGN